MENDQITELKYIDEITELKYIDEITELKYIINYVWNHSNIGLFI